MTLLARMQEVRWIAPPRGSLRHGWIWMSHPRLFTVAIVALVVVILALALRQRFRG